MSTIGPGGTKRSTNASGTDDGDFHSRTPRYFRFRTLYRQERLGPVRGQVGVERVDQQRQETVVPHDETELDHALATELLQRRLKRSAADAVGPEEFSAVVHHRRLVGRQARKVLTVAQGVD